MTTRVMILWCVATLATAAQGQTGRSSDVAATYPYTGVLTRTRVYVRCGVGDRSGRNNYYYCAMLDRSDKVQVVGAKDGWLRILPPKGCYSVIAQNAVAVDATATVGTVTRDRVWVRAAGVLHPARFTAGQCRLNRGDKVEILGTLTDDFEKWYKIKSPRGVCFWIFGTFVEPVRPKAPTTKPKATAPDEPVTTRPTVAAAPPSAEKEALDAFRAAEEALQAEYEKPADQRDLEGLVQKFHNIKLVEKSPLEPYVDYYVKFLISEIARRVDLADAERLSLKSAEEQKKLDLAIIRADTDEKIAAAIPFTTRGVLSPSRMFVGVTGAKRYIVYAPKTHRLNAYVQSTKGDVDLEQYVGKNVGIYGTTKYDRELAIDIIEAREVVVVAGEAQVPALPQPIVKPMPVPAAKPEPAKPVEPAPAPEAEPEPIAEPKVTEAEKPEPAPVAKPLEVPEPERAPAPEPEPELEPIAEPKVTEAEKPEPAPVAKPLEVPEPVVEPEPEPAPAPEVEPELEPIAEPKVTEAEKPEPAPVAKPLEVPEPVVEPEPEPAPAPEAKPLEVPEPEPARPVELAPAPEVEPEPEPIVEPTPAPEIEPELEPMDQPAVEPIPLEAIAPADKPVPTTKPDIKPVPLPTTQPAGEKKFPKPLPPTGLPLAEPEEVPDNMPIHEDEYE